MSLSASICQESGNLQDDGDDDSDCDQSYQRTQDETAEPSDANSDPTPPSNICTSRSNALIQERLNGSTVDPSEGEEDDSLSQKVQSWRDHPVGQRSAYQSSKAADICDQMRSELHASGTSRSGVTITARSDATSRQDSFNMSCGQDSYSSKQQRNSVDSPFPSFRAGVAESKESTRGSYLSGTGYDEQTLAVYIRTFSIIAASLLQRCVIGDGSFLDINTCSTHEADSSSSLLAKRRRNSDSRKVAGAEEGFRPLSASLQCQSLVGPVLAGGGGASAEEGSSPPSPIPSPTPWLMKSSRKASTQRKQINMLFSIREYLESVPDSEQHNMTPILTEIANFSLGASMRVLKLVSPYMFNSCLPSHMGEAEKIGTGGFGSVFRVTCSANCADFQASVGTKNTPYQSYTSRSNSGKKSGLMNAFNSAAKQSQVLSIKNDNGSTACRTNYAVKRIPRERSVYDSPIIYDIFSEITCLELLAGNKGVSHSVLNHSCPILPCLALFCPSTSVNVSVKRIFTSTFSSSSPMNKYYGVLQILTLRRCLHPSIDRSLFLHTSSTAQDLLDCTHLLIHSSTLISVNIRCANCSISECKV